MLSFKKNQNVPKLFTEGVAGLSGYDTYDQLMADESRKNNVLAVLLNDQGCLCPFCERRIAMPKAASHPATIDHFLPQSRFPEIQINYYNLIAACQMCNTLKGDNLLPAYIYDSQFDSTSTQIVFREGNIKLHFAEHHLDSDVSLIKIPSYEKSLRSGKLPLPHDHLLYFTIELLELNQRSNLKEARNAVHTTLQQELKTKSDKQILRIWQKLAEGTSTFVALDKANYPCLQLEEYLSLKIEVLKKTLEKRGIDSYAKFQKELNRL